MSSATRYQPLGSVIFQTIANETVIINLENGRYYSLNPTASIIWEELMRQANADEIAEQFPPPENPEPPAVVSAITRYIDELIAEDLLEPAPAGARNSSPNTPALNRVRFETPTLDKYTDMEELIPLDPIHQVGTMGWPYHIRDQTDPGA